MVRKVDDGHRIVGLETEARRTGVHENYVLQLPIRTLDASQILDVQIPQVYALVLVDPLGYVLPVRIKIIQHQVRMSLVAGRPDDDLKLLVQRHEDFEGVGTHIDADLWKDMLGCECKFIMGVTYSQLPLDRMTKTLSAFYRDFSKWMRTSSRPNMMVFLSRRGLEGEI